MDFPSARIVFFVVLVVYLLAQLYLFLRIRDTLSVRVQDQKRKRLLFGLVAFFFLLMLYPLAWRAVTGFRLYEPFPSVLRGFLAFWVVGSMGSAIVLLAYDCFRRFVRLGSARPVEPDLQRRDFLKKGVGVLAATPFFISGYGVLLARHRFQVEHFDLPLNGLSSALSHLSIVHLTDIHVGPFMPEEELAAYVEAVNRLDADFIALTGDFVSSSPDEAGPCVDTLAGLKARYGIFACMGNHDVFAHADEELTRLFSQKGVRVLRNDAIPVRVGNTTLNILGIDDLRWGKPDLGRALKVAQKEPGEVRLLLSHRPEVFPDAARKGLDVVLSGHYHGGQVKLSPDPEGISIARLITPYAEGLFHLSRPSGAEPKDAMLFVSRGIGITGLPIRVNCPPQIAHLTLKKA
ncbi:MAG: metallophosphoesterase [Candidatus Binatia bacterium]